MPNTNTYTKRTLNDIKRKLNEGEYKSLAGANRAIGKSHGLTDKEKEKAKRLAAAHFEDEGKQAKKASKKKAKKKAGKKGKKKAAKKAGAKTKKKSAKKAASKKKAATKRQPRTTGVKAAPQGPANDVAVEQMDVPQIRRRPAAVAGLASSVIDSVTKGIAGLKDAKELSKDGVDIEASVSSGINTLGKAMTLLERDVADPMLALKSGNGKSHSSSNGAPSPEEQKAAELLKQTAPTQLDIPLASPDFQADSD